MTAKENGRRKMYKNMVEILPEGKIGDFEVSHFEMTEDDVRLARVLDIFNHDCECVGLEPGRYVRLTYNKHIWMSDTWMEKHTNDYFVRKANGDVLVAGLGIGLIITAIQSKEDVRSITVVEKNKEVIDLVLPHLPKEKLTVVHADIFDYRPERKYDTIYFDIWPDISVDNYDDMKRLHRRFCRGLNRENPKAWMSSWRKSYVQGLVRSEKACERFRGNLFDGC
jgi:hypothetical protein